MTTGMHTTQRPRGRRRGQASLEFAVVGVVLLLLACGVVDFSRAILARQTLSWLTREAANLAARGVPLADIVESTFVSGRRLDMRRSGGVVLTKVYRDAANRVRIVEQVTGGGRSVVSKLGVGVGSVPILPVTRAVYPPVGQAAFVAELTIGFRAVTPLGALLGNVLPSELSNAAYF